LPKDITSLRRLEDAEKKSFSHLYEKIQRTHFHTPPFFMDAQFYPTEPQDFCENILKAQQHIASRKWRGRTSFFTLV